MMTAKRDAMYARIEAHGRALLELFPNAAQRDPVKLCKALRREETHMHGFAERLCNGTVEQSAYDAEVIRCTARLYKLLGLGADVDEPQVVVNGDPRGYALKISDDWMRGRETSLHRDWGGYGILAPDLTDAD